MKKNIIYLIGIAVILTAILLYNKTFNNGGLSNKIVIKDTSEIFKIKIEKLNEEITIYKNENNWFLTNQIPARSEAISDLLMIINQIKIKNPVQKDIYDSIFTSLNKTGKKISVYDDNEKLISKWIVGSYESDFNGTYLFSEKSENIYIVSIPGVLVDLNKKIQTNELYWIKRNIFNLDYYDIKEINVKYSDSIRNSFKLKIFDNNAELYSIKNNIQIDSLNFRSIGRYLTYFRDVKFSNFPTDLNPNVTDSILKSDPLHIIEVVDKKGNKKTLKTFEKNTPRILDIHNVFASINNEDKLVIVKYYDIDLLLKDIRYFTK